MRATADANRLLSSYAARARFALGVLLWLASAVLGLTTTHAQEAGATLYVRTDTDHTTVITPRVHAAAPIGEGTRADLVYTADVWTSASIDIRASASKAITERRDELRGSLSHEWQDVTLSGGYRYSYEPDYVSHSVSSNLTFDLADNSATLVIGGSASFDTVGRVGDPGFSRGTNAFTGQVGLTQVIDPQTLVQAVYEVGYADGYLASPYRYVGVGTPNGLCNSPGGSGGIEYCLPEHNPDERMRHAVFLQGRRALSESTSLGIGYRFYIDDWRLMSHTAMADLSWAIDTDFLLTLRYRFYLQTAASQYKPNYVEIQKFMTRDKELSAFSTHKVALELERAWDVGEVGRKLRALVSVGPSIYLYQNFIPLKSISALDLTFSMVLTL
jgi:hypothetical protein